MGNEHKAFYRKEIDPRRLPDTIRYKWPREVLIEGVAALPKRFLRTAHHIFHGDDPLGLFIVAMTLADYRREDARDPNIEFLAYLSGLGRDRFRRNLEELEKRDLVRVKHIDETIRFDITRLCDEIARQAESAHDEGSD
jgi:hypothetical protein